ncbi:hypothetical protein LCM27_01860 [Ruegeria marisrubri]|uniref:hypothetical protein n=1 Tax=Ruegeria marisrubri TaxID=1685379 RepID=UPI001CD68723|nr:hypothetical protein [Ruegeria marisrubri]MCA0905138.1 hypothetical protein [Ruegeria marisrubri]
MTTAIDLGAALDTVVANIAAKFPTFKTVAAEDEKREQLLLPAILVQVSELEPLPDQDPHTGQFPCLVRFEARIVMGHRTATVRREVLKAAGALSVHIHNSRLGVKWGGATVLSVEPDEFAPKADQFDIWLVEWAHEACIGDTYFVDSGATPTQVLTSWAPDVSTANQSKYEAL